MPHLGHYELLAQLGAGGMCDVWRARAPQGDAAVKVLRSEYAIDLLQREVFMMARMNHPGIVRIHAWGQMSDAEARGAEHPAGHPMARDGPR